MEKIADRKEMGSALKADRAFLEKMRTDITKFDSVNPHERVAKLEFLAMCLRLTKKSYDGMLKDKEVHTAEKIEIIKFTKDVTSFLLELDCRIMKELPALKDTELVKYVRFVLSGEQKKFKLFSTDFALEGKSDEEILKFGEALVPLRLGLYEMDVAFNKVGMNISQAIDKNAIISKNLASEDPDDVSLLTIVDGRIRDRIEALHSHLRKNVSGLSVKLITPAKTDVNLANSRFLQDTEENRKRLDEIEKSLHSKDSAPLKLVSLEKGFLELQKFKSVLEDTVRCMMSDNAPMNDTVAMSELVLEASVMQLSTLKKIKKS